MGIIRAAVSSAMDVAGEQWKEFFYCDSLPENILLVRGRKHISEHSANNRADDGGSTNGSIIAVADGQGAIAVSQGKVIDQYTEPGEHIFEDPYHPGGVKGFLKETGNRISFGGGVQAVQQRIYYFNTKEIMGIPFDCAVPTELLEGSFQSGLSLSGVFSYRVCEPAVFYKMVTGNVSMQYERSRLNGMLVSELRTALMQAAGKTSFFRTSDWGLHTDDLITSLKAELNPMWREKRGLEAVSVALNAGDFSAGEAIGNIQMTAVYAPKTPGEVSPERQLAADPSAEETPKTEAANPSAVEAAKTEAANPSAAEGTKMAPAKGSERANAEEEWRCSCGTLSKLNFCPECGAKRPVEWTCSCGTVTAGNFCPECGAKRPVEWTCSCGTVTASNFCPECGAKRPK